MTVRILRGDCREVLRSLPNDSVHCCVTSPPYFGLRDYGTAQWDGGDLECDHLRPAAHGYSPADTSTLGPNRDGCGADNKAHSDGVKRQQFAGACGKCGARRIDAQLGLERTPAEYVAQLVEVFREVRRVLRDDGTVWLNLGDSYAGSWGAQGRRITESDEPSWHSSQIRNHPKRASNTGSICQEGLKPKDLMMIPARVALALQDDGWWLRSDIIWHKPNPMPESVGDRPTSAHEHVFLLAKSATYFFDAEAVRETGVIPAGTLGAKGSEERFNTPGVNSRPPEYKTYTGTRNIRNVWTVATAPYSDAHFATFPPDLIEPCIKAGTSERGCCAKCGAPWGRVVERFVAFTSGSGKAGNVPTGKYHGTEQAESGTYDIRMGPSVSAVTTGWQPSCSCGAATVPATVLDCFGGAGTTGLVADRLGRDAVLIELNADYADMAERRLVADAGLFAQVAAQ